MLLSFRAEDAFGDETDQAARLLGRSRSEHLRAAVEQENRRVLEERLVFLSHQLSEVSLAVNQDMEASNGDGLDEG